MAVKQFNVFENPSPEARRFAPYLVVLSSHLVLDFDDAVVAPLVNDSQATVGSLEIEVDFASENLVLVVSELAAMAGRNLKRRVGSLAAHEDDIRRALDRLFTGF
ncbi:CcdB family protein [Brevundimonas sp.]|uniref:CcdB family protein n=1 Tax=Brevundimonas sp. TaxID=1871086 RepID=UPI0037BE86B9